MQKNRRRLLLLPALLAAAALSGCYHHTARLAVRRLPPEDRIRIWAKLRLLRRADAKEDATKKAGQTRFCSLWNYCFMSVASLGGSG